MQAPTMKREKAFSDLDFGFSNQYILDWMGFRCILKKKDNNYQHFFEDGVQDG